MFAKQESWRQQIQKYRRAIGAVVIILIIGVVIALIVVGYSSNWTGFNGYSPPTPQYQREKTLWDWLQLLIIPLVLAVAALLFNRANSRTEQKIALDKQRQDLLQAYLDRMAELLLDKQLGTSASQAVHNVARVRTITVLTQLDARRIGYVFAFLREAGLMSNKLNTSIVSLSKVDLSNVNWSKANLSASNLSGANLTGANLSGAFLYRINLSGANLSGADLSKAHLNGADLSKADLNGVDLGRANLSGADLSKTNLSNANLTGANLKGANLSGAIITEEQLKKAKSLQGATMPDGTES